MYKLCFFVPASHVEQVKQAVFAAGAGRLGNYDSCSWQVLGQGQFRPLSGSEPYQPVEIRRDDYVHCFWQQRSRSFTSR
ncbi:MAG: hypothetical protein V7748_18580, partial [Halopseudomonas sp.]